VTPAWRSHRLRSKRRSTPSPCGLRVQNGKVNWEALDREGSKVRMRLGSTAVRVEHEGPPDSSSAVLVTYLKEGKAYRVKAKGVVMAGGQHMNKHVVRGDGPVSSWADADGERGHPGSAGTPASGPPW